MTRERLRLSDKQERILVQCQLMGITAKEFQQIATRFRALDQERQFKAIVDQTITGFTWEIRKPKDFTLFTPCGKRCEVSFVRNQRALASDVYNYLANITVFENGKTVRWVIDARLHKHPWEVVAVCPEQMVVENNLRNC
jgi:hypothetical protein